MRLGVYSSSSTLLSGKALSLVGYQKLSPKSVSLWPLQHERYLSCPGLKPFNSLTVKQEIMLNPHWLTSLLTIFHHQSKTRWVGSQWAWFLIDIGQK